MIRFPFVLAFVLALSTSGQVRAQELGDLLRGGAAILLEIQRQEHQRTAQPPQASPTRIAQSEQRAMVRRIQAQLADLGYDPGPVDGLMGPRTRRAIMAFQRAYGLDPTGEVNAVTAAAAQAAWTSRTRMAEPAPAPNTVVEPSFDCARASTATERAICANAQLAALDRQLSQRYAAVRDRLAGAAADALVAQQRRWIARRDRCGSDARCLAEHMTARIATLDAATAAAGGVAPSIDGAAGVQRQEPPTDGQALAFGNGEQVGESAATTVADPRMPLVDGLPALYATSFYRNPDPFRSLADSRFDYAFRLPYFFYRMLLGEAAETGTSDRFVPWTAQTLHNDTIRQIAVRALGEVPSIFDHTRRSGERGLELAAYIEAASANRSNIHGLNEFDQRRLETAITAAAAARTSSEAIAARQSMMLICRIMLPEYDFDNERFNLPVAALRDGCVRPARLQGSSQIRWMDAGIELSVRAGGLPAHWPMAPEAAEALVGDASRLDRPSVYLVAPVDVTASLDTVTDGRRDRHTVRITGERIGPFTLRDPADLARILYTFDDNALDRSRIAPLAYLEDPGQAIDPRLPYRHDFETGRLLALRAGADLDEDRWRQWLEARVRREQEIYRDDVGSNWYRYDDWGPFFARADFAVNAERLGAFKAWSRARAAALPATMTIRSDMFYYLPTADEPGRFRLADRTFDRRDGDRLPVLGARIDTVREFNLDRDLGGMTVVGAYRPGARTASWVDALLQNELGGGADRTVQVGERGVLLLPAPLSDYDVALSHDALASRAADGETGMRFWLDLEVALGDSGIYTVEGSAYVATAITPQQVTMRLEDGAVIDRADLTGVPARDFGQVVTDVVTTDAPATALTEEIVDLLRLRHLSDTVEKADLERMFVQRFLYEKAAEQAGSTPQGGTFFANVAFLPEGARRQAMLPTFRQWSAARARSLPQQVIVRLPWPPGALDRFGRPNTPFHAPGFTRHGRDCTAAVLDLDAAALAARASTLGLADRRELQRCIVLQAADHYAEPTLFLTNARPQHASGPQCDRQGDRYCRLKGDAYDMVPGARPLQHLFFALDKVPGLSGLPGEGVAGAMLELRLVVADGERLSRFPQTRAEKARAAIAEFNARWGEGATRADEPVQFNGMAASLQASVSSARIVNAETGENLYALRLEDPRPLPLHLLDDDPFSAPGEAGLSDDGAQRPSDAATGRDILGIRLGMTLTEAEAIVRERIDVGTVLAADRADQLATLTDGPMPYSSGRLFVSADGKEAIALFNEPPAAPDELVAAFRVVFLPDGSVSEGPLGRSLIERYGEPVATAPAGNAYRGGFRWIWADQPLEHDCTISVEGRQTDLWSQLVEGDGWEPPPPLYDYLLPHLRARPDLRPERLDDPQLRSRLCPDLLAVQMVNYEPARHIPAETSTVIMTWMFDELGYVDDLRASRDRIAAGDPVTQTQAEDAELPIEF